MLQQLSDLPNIGPVLLEKLIDVGISTPGRLAKTGSKKAFLKIRVNDPGACLDMLYALEGAIRGIRWHELPAATKRELKTFKMKLPDN